MSSTKQTAIEQSVLAYVNEILSSCYTETGASGASADLEEVGYAYLPL